VRWLRRTYRTTRQIYDLAGCLLDESDDLQEELAQMLPPDRFGTRPLFLIEADKKNLLDLLIDRIAQVAAEKPANQIGIIAAKWDTLKDIEQRLVERGIPTAPAERGTIRLNEASVKLLSMHSVKGLDFPYVFLVGPRAYDLGGTTHNLLPETRRLFYVALTRASENLTVGILAGKHHPLLEKLDDALYEAQGSQAHSFINGRGVSVDSQGIVSVNH
jgi:superfamily I DNA/RNA helicase